MRQDKTADASSPDVAIYLDDQVNVGRGVGDGKDAGPGQGGGVHVRSVRFQEMLKLFRVEIIVKVLRYLRGGKEPKLSVSSRLEWCCFHILLGSRTH